MKYIAQTGCTFHTRYNEHIREIKTNSKTSKYAQHILDTMHNYSKTEESMKILHIEKRGIMPDTVESYLYKITKRNTKQ
jgi:hypothetical protein